MHSQSHTLTGIAWVLVHLLLLLLIVPFLLWFVFAVPSPLLFRCVVCVFGVLPFLGRCFLAFSPAFSSPVFFSPVRAFGCGA